MCGIVGFVGGGERRVLERMTDAVRHRGPDGGAVFVDADTRVHLGHRRLAILDIAGGIQPMWNEDGTVAVIYNGEIYNHLELRAALVAAGHVFRSDHSDTEILVHGYEEWGTDLPRRLNGMFAFAIFDRNHRRLFLARDRFGEKPLYYALRPGLFLFASEMHALCRHPGLPRTLRPDAIQKFLAYGFLPAPHTLLADVFKLPGGCHLTYDIEGQAAHVERYWRFTLEPDEGRAAVGVGPLAEELRHLLFQAVKRRLISDVPLGLFLSGGIDSSAVLAGAASVLPPEMIRAYTVGFAEPSFDESEYAALLAKTYGAQHAVDQLELDDMRELIPSVLARLDEPLGDASILPTYVLSRFTRRHVTVALSGDGGDELFAGYDPFKALAAARWYQSVIPRNVHRGLRRLVDVLPFSDRNMSLEFKLRRSLIGLSYPPAMWNPAWLSPLHPELLAEFCEDPLPADELYSEAIGLWNHGDERELIDRTLEFYVTFYLQDNILLKVDRAAMMSSLESRAVFLDNDLVDFCRRLPWRFKYHHGERKYLLKLALAGVLPDVILKRPKKGFGIPLAKWLRSVPEEPPMEALPGVRLDRVRRAWREHRQGGADQRLFLWSWLSLQACARRYRAPAVA